MAAADPTVYDAGAMQKSILAMIMAGGRGSRLFPLTQARAKPAVPFGGKYRIIDFVLSNFVNSGIYSIYVLTQFKSQSLTEHIQHGWAFTGILPDHFVRPVPAQMQRGDAWYEGTADAIFQNLNLIRDSAPDLVCIFGGDHIYRMDIRQMVAYHEEKRSEITVAATVVPRATASQFGVLSVDPEWRIIGFEEKPSDPRPIPGDPDRCLVSMGNYVFTRTALEEALEEDAASTRSSHDFGKDVLPRAIASRRMYCYDFTSNRVPGEPGPNTYWRDVGTIESYFESTMDLRTVVPDFNLYNRRWPIRTAWYGYPPVKFVHDEGKRIGRAVNSLVCEGSILSGCSVTGSILGRNVKIHSFAEVSESIIFDHVEVGRGARIHRAIIDKNVKIPEGARIGVDPAEDARNHFVSPTGIVVIPKSPQSDPHVGVLRL